MDSTSYEFLQISLFRFNLTNKYILNVNNRNTRKGVKYVKSYHFIFKFAHCTYFTFLEFLLMTLKGKCLLEKNSCFHEHCSRVPAVVFKELFSHWISFPSTQRTKSMFKKNWARKIKMPRCSASKTLWAKNFLWQNF